MGQQSRSRLIRAWVSIAALCGAAMAMIVAEPAWADTNAANQAAADAVFSDASKRLQAQDYASACPKFVEAQRLDPTPGTLLNLGLCYEQWGKLASALGAYADAEAMAARVNDRARQNEASRRIKIVEPQVARLTINVSGSARIPGLTVKRDSESIGAPLWGTAIPVDSGEYAIEAAAPGRITWAGKTLILATTGSLTIEIPTLDAVPVEPAKRTQAIASSAEPVMWWTGQRATGLVVGGVGVTGIVVGSIFGARALSKQSASNADGHCDVGDFCDPTGKALRSDGIQAGTISTVGFIVSGAALAGGVVLMLTGAPPPKSAVASATSVQIGLGNLTLLGRW